MYNIRDSAKAPRHETKKRPATNFVFLNPAYIPANR